jgi:hypothetical protein
MHGASIPWAAERVLHVRPGEEQRCLCKRVDSWSGWMMFVPAHRMSYCEQRQCEQRIASLTMAGHALIDRRCPRMGESGLHSHSWRG